MIYLTQLIFINEGKESAFNEFESIAIPLMEEYNGNMIYRIKPSSDSFVTANEELPYEIHFLSFPNDSSLKDFLKDERRTDIVHLKNESIRTSYIIKGEKL